MARRQTPAEKLGLEEHVLCLGMVDFDVMLIIGPHKAALHYVRYKNQDPNFDGGAEVAGFHCHKDGYPSIVWLPAKPVTAREFGTLAHEMFHAVRRMGDHIQIKLNADTQEIFCHALGHLVKAALEAMDMKGGHRYGTANAKRA